MISALKKFSRKNDGPKSRPSMPSGISSMGQSLQRKFGRGIHYNMKIVVKGDRNTGKSTLLARFQGKPFREEYLPTNQIQVCSINWNYKVADDVVKVEVWDVVDKGKRKKSTGDGLKFHNDASNESEMSDVLDAQFLDVYKGAHGCIILLDITKQWTFQYVERELPKVPGNVPVLILANFLDMQEHRVVQREVIESYAKYFDRGKDSAMIHYGECSMKNGFGLKYIHKFFNIPFLNLQRETLTQQLETNKEDMEATLEELSFQRESEEQNYEKFLNYMANKSAEKKQPTSNSSENNVSSRRTATSVTTKNTDSNKITVSNAKGKTNSQTLDDFIPEDTIESGFLDEKGQSVKTDNTSEDSSSDDNDSEDGVNPMVSGFKDISSDENDIHQDHKTQQPNQIPLTSSLNADVQLTSEESDNSDDKTVQVSKINDKDIISPEIESDKDEPESKIELSLESSKIKSDVVLNDDDVSFMDAWLDSPSTDPREISVKPRKTVRSNENAIGVNELDMFEASQLSSKTSRSTQDVVKDDKLSSHSDNNSEETKKKRSETLSKDVEESKHKHRSKHKHKKKSRTKDTQEDDKKHKSKKKGRHKENKDRQDNGADYELF